MATAPVSARRVTVVEDEGATFGVPRLLLRGAPRPVTPGIVTWALRYGGPGLNSFVWAFWSTYPAIIFCWYGLHGAGA